MGTIIGIVVGAIVIVLIIAGILFVCCRKRRNRRLRLEGNRSSALGPELGRDCPASPLSFRCQTHVTPRSPEFHRSITEPTLDAEKVYPGPYASFRPYSVSPVSPPLSPGSMWPIQNPVSDNKSSYLDRDNTDRALHNITTTIAAPTFPGNVHYAVSPKSAGAPFSPDDDIAPPSTVSARSTTQLLMPQLKPYNPAEYAAGGSSSYSHHQQQAVVSTPESTYASPTSGSTASPLLSRAWDQRTTPAWDVPSQQQQQQQQHNQRGGPGRPNLAGAFGKATLVVAGKGRRISGNGNGNGSSSPIETSQINTVFAAPPTGRR